MRTHSLGWAEILGLSPLGERLQQAKMALSGDEFTPKTRFGLSSLKILKPAWAAAMWRGKRPFGQLVPIYNLFNRTQTPVEAGWSVRKTSVRDFRGGSLTYDSHNGTDFATPPGTVIVAPAAGVVRLIVDEYHRGGKKLLLDHGGGLLTVQAHLARSLVSVGEEVGAGQPVALSGASGINFVAGAFMDPPHLHLNTWLAGVPVDPFAADDSETSLWNQRNDPQPIAPQAVPSERRWRDSNLYDPERVAEQIECCREPRMKARLLAVADLATRAAHTVFFRNYYPTRFSSVVAPAVVCDPPPLALPFGQTDYMGIRL